MHLRLAGEHSLLLYSWQWHLNIAKLRSSATEDTRWEPKTIINLDDPALVLEPVHAVHNG